MTLHRKNYTELYIQSVQSDVGKALDIILVTALMGGCTQAGRHVCFPLFFMGHNLEGLLANPKLSPNANTHKAVALNLSLYTKGRCIHCYSKSPQF